MRSFIIALVIVLTTSVTNAQTKAATDANADKFVSYYNDGNAEGIYTMLANNLKSGTSVAAINTALKQLKTAVGGLTKSEYVNTDSQGANYIAAFERGGLVMKFNFNSDSKLTGFYTAKDEREQPVVADLPGTVTVETIGAILKGTLTMPDGAQNIPVVLLIAGSGPTDRDGNSALSNGKSNEYQMLAKVLKVKNIAVLRYDKRGVGQSTKAQNSTFFNDYIDDAAAMIKFLKADKRFSKVIVAGHSEGSLIGMIAAKREKADAFISLAGAGFPVDAVLKTQIKDRASAKSYKKAVLMIDSIKAGQFVRQKLDPGFEGLFSPAIQPFLRSLMQYDPQLEISKLTVPVLLVQGTTDMQVSVENAKLLKKADPNAQLKLIPGMSHILKEGPSNMKLNLATYEKSDLPLHPGLIPVLTDFINAIK